MAFKKTRSETKELYQKWLNKAEEFINSRKSWEILVGGMVIGAILVAFSQFFFAFVFVIAVCGFVYYYLSPETTSEKSNDVDITHDNKNDDEK